MYQECRHIKPNGCKCHSPAMNDKAFCYYHLRVHKASRTPAAPFEQRDLEIPFLEDRGAVQIALSEVVSALAERRIEFKRASLMVYALQVASSNARVPADLTAAEPVRNSFQSEQGEELAPEITTLEPEDEGYEEANHEPTLAELLLAEIRRPIAEGEIRPAGLPEPDEKEANSFAC